MRVARPVLHGQDHLPGGADPITIPAAVASVPWMLVNSSGIVLPSTVSGAGFGGSDWALLPVAGDTPYPLTFTKAIAFSNAADRSAGHGFMPSYELGDLYQAGASIFMNYAPLTDYGFVEGDKASSVRIAAGSHGVYRVHVKFFARGAAAANQMVGVFGSLMNLYDALEWGTDGGNGTFGVPGVAPTLPDGRVGSAAFTDPGDTKFLAAGRVVGEWVSVVSPGDDSAPADIVFRGWNPGPDEVTLDLGVMVEKLDSSDASIFSE